MIKRFLPAELLTLLYILLTGIYILIFKQGIYSGMAVDLLLFRLLFAGIICFLAYITRSDGKAKPMITATLSFVRYAFPLALITYWYPETFYMNECLFDNLDPVFEGIDQWLFGCQPALEFSKALPFRWLSELMSFGYFSYFLILIFIAVYLYFANKKAGEKAVFVLLCSFFIYYVLFIILPVVGPQFYFPDNQVPDGYIFRPILITAQSAGEKPTGAFPSSHVGMSIIYLIILYKYARKYFAYFLPIVIILIISTVYIKAHYVIDVIGGAVSAPIIYFCANKISNSLR
ncbi:MAG: phosphatase PAP2 family protein [Dysgonamonadaceae bacterium]|jgi:membrane-associated phospholipid phosphatase|nr:phosphatase PAP2 family protein [Dysgonamonadaceae bacterium]